jgi:hypothetical protein
MYRMPVTHFPIGTPFDPGNSFASGASIGIGVCKPAPKLPDPDFGQGYCDAINAEVRRLYPDLSFDDALLAIANAMDAEADAEAIAWLKAHPDDPMLKF